MSTTPVQDTRTRYTLLKNIIASGWQRVLETHEAVVEMKETKLYLEEFRTWEEFCNSVLHHTPQHVNRVLKSASISKQLTEESEPVGSLLGNERQARALAEVAPDKRREVLEKVAANGRVTAKTIATVAKSIKEPEAPKLYDRTGFEIPQPSPACLTWLRLDEVNAMLTAISRIKGVIVGADGGKDSLYAEINTSALVADLTSSFSQLKVALPFAVCPTCQGRVLSPCTTCGGRGMISEFYWKHKVPEKTKEIRERAVEAMLEKKGSKK